MNLFGNKKKVQQRSVAFAMPTQFDELCVSGYAPLSRNPEIVAACRRIADLISSMTIYLMANTESGDKRIKNELSRLVDVLPCSTMTRKTWMDYIVMTMLLYGKGNAVVEPITKKGLLDEMIPVPPCDVSFVEQGYGSYQIIVNGRKRNPNDLLHFVYNPDERRPYLGQGVTLSLADVADTLRQANATKKGFMASKWKPSLIIKVDALTDEFSSPEGRKKLMESYIENTKAGEPWMIPAEQFSVEQVRPLSLGDLAISESVELDKKTVASILGVPPFVLGVGTYNKDEWNGFISNTIRPIAREIEQELTRKLLTSTKMYWRFNISSIYAYDLQTMNAVYGDMFVKGCCTGNEYRDKMGMEPKEGLEQLVILENYIPLSAVGDQMKLKQEE